MKKEGLKVGNIVGKKKPKKTLYFDARESYHFTRDSQHFMFGDNYFECHGLTKDELVEKGYSWFDDMFTTEKPEPLKIIDGRVE